jgi:putative FmdB family regulatory protein
MRLFDFCCSECNSVFEKLVRANIREIKCECGGEAKRIISMPTVKLEGISGDFPSASDNWARIREERHRVSAKKSYARP